MAKENLSDEEYLDSLLKNLSQDEEEKASIDENAETVVTDKGKQGELSDAEIDAAADESLSQLLKAGTDGLDFGDDISLQQLIDREQGLSLEEEPTESLDAESTSREQENGTANDEALQDTAEEQAMDAYGLGFEADETMEQGAAEETEPEKADSGMNQNAGAQDSVDEELGIGLEDAMGLNQEETSSQDELLDSLSSIVREIHEDSVPVRSDLSGVEKLEEKPKKKKEKKKKAEKRKAAGEKPAKKKVQRQSRFLKKLQDSFFKIEVVDLEEEAEQENRRKQEKEEQKKAKAIEREQLKKQKQEEKKAADAKKRELAQAKKQEKERKRQEKKARKAELEASLGSEERVKLKPAFLAFSGTVIAVMAIAIVLLSGSFSYRNNIKAAERGLKVKNYEEAYRVLAGMELKKDDMLLYQKIELLVRLDKQYDGYVNFRNLKMPKEALNALIQGMTIYYANTETIKELKLEAETDELKETLLYSLTNDFGLDEEKVMKLCSLEDTNEYTREIELYSANQVQ